MTDEPKPEATKEPEASTPPADTGSKPVDPPKEEAKS
jgi:hypothetical protein